MARQSGFTYVIVMFLVAVLSIISVRALENTLTTERRDKEAQLLLVGQAYADAIAAYYNGSPGTEKRWPQKPEDLLLDQRTNRTFRAIRKLYRDPLTGAKEWGYVYNGDDLVGVYSLSPQKPLKRDQFPPNQAGFKNANSYRDWKFVYAGQ